MRERVLTSASMLGALSVFGYVFLIAATPGLAFANPNRHDLWSLGGGRCSIKRFQSRPLWAAVPSSTAGSTLVPKATAAAAATGRSVWQRVAYGGEAAAAANSLLWKRPSRVTILAWVLGALLLREKWDQVPKWLQNVLLLPWKKLMGRSKQKTKETSASDIEFADNNIVQKVLNVMALAQSVTDSVPFEGFQLQFALLVMLQMVEQSKKRTAELWDNFYESSGEPLLFGDATGEEKSSANNAAMVHTWIDQLHLSDWAYLEETEEIRSKLQELTTNSSSSSSWQLIRHVKTDEPGRVGHYVAIDTHSKVALISVKGTSALADMATDACSVPVRYNVTQLHDHEGKQQGENTVTTVSCHQGILDASVALAEEVQPLVEYLFLPAGYKILLVGHSLGAGVACMVGMLLRARLPALRQKQEETSPALDIMLSDGASQADLPLEVVAFAPPPMLNLEAAVATSPFTTTIVNNDDMIPRSSLNNLGYLLRFVGIVNERLAKNGLRPTGPEGTVKLLQKVLANGDEEAKWDSTMTAQEIFDGINEVQGEGNTANEYRNRVSEDKDHLFVPGRVIILYEKLVAKAAKNAKLESIAANIATEELLSTQDVSQKTKGLEKVGGPANEERKDIVTEVLPDQKDESEILDAGAVVADGAAPVLRHINVNQRMLSDHMPDAYEKMLRALL